MLFQKKITAKTLNEEKKKAKSDKALRIYNANCKEDSKFPT